ncbi:Tex family protein [Fuchsiella alkaliacetigena]|uniref:Tex family protein n=1 Tax=Fuchsiella alkaliacetigena TaxID=957042 RepID=UPI002009EFBC|nr:Tex family protein [Fuchsiella alkaliacetigena]MCK8824904.1 RNA-binding transcriptional accessory protein [Fuchsiella alkaliacetigena]
MQEKEIKKKLAAELDLDLNQVASTISLLDQGNTIPFIARYRKEATNNLTETQLRNLKERLAYLRNLTARKEKVLKLIAKQGKLKPELKAKIEKATKLQTVEDLYRPYRPKKKTRAAKAKEKGLNPLAKKFLAQKIETGSIAKEAQSYLAPDKGLARIEEVLQGVKDIIAEEVANRAQVRALARKLTFNKGSLKSVVITEKQGTYRDYYDYQEALSKIPPHRTLAINRGEAEDVLRVKVVAPARLILTEIKKLIIKNKNTLFIKHLEKAIEESYRRLIAPAIAREVRSKLTEKASTHAIDIFAKNLRRLLLQPPIRDKVVLGVDPGFRTGAKLAIVDQLGNLLETATVYLHSSAKAEQIIRSLINNYQVDIIAIGNGTASRETEELIAEVISTLEQKVAYTIVNEAGASVYSASQVAQKELPELDVSLRGAVSIARRLQDPLAELVKIKPQHIGVGMYQHDLKESELAAALESVVESVVNYVGVNLNTASPALLNYVAGINKQVAEKIVEQRQEKGRFEKRNELKEVYGVGPKTFLQAAGFLRIYEGQDKLAMTPIHPESYFLVKKLLNKIGFNLQTIDFQRDQAELKERLKNLHFEDLEFEMGNYTFLDIKKALLRPGRDPREDLPKPIFKEGVVKLADLKSGLVLRGTVRNVVDFGAFVDIGVKVEGLVHVSELSSGYVDSPLEVLKVGDVVRVKVLSIDQKRKRIALTMNF